MNPCTPDVSLCVCSPRQPEGPSLEERRSLSRYGVWLLVNLCTPDRTTPDQTLARLLAALFNWFEATAYLGDGMSESGEGCEVLGNEISCADAECSLGV